MPNVIRVPSLRLTELDGSPDIQGVERIYMTNGVLSSLGGGGALLSLSGTAGGAVTIRDIDGVPSVTPLNTLYVTNGFLSDLGGGNALLSLSGTGGGAPTTASYWVEAADAGLSNEVVTGTTGIHSLSYGARNPSGAAGRLFLPTDAYEIQRDNGSSWDTWGPLFKLTPPVDTDFFWLNQGTATATTVGGTYLLGPVGSGTNIRARMKLKTPPYTITVEVEQGCYGVANAGSGVLFADAAGQLHTMLFQHNGTSFGMYSAKWTNVTTFSASYAGSPVIMSAYPRFLRIADNGANRIISWSNDSQNFHVFHTVGRTDFLTADRVGFFVNPDNATYPAAITVLSWTETV